MHPALSVIFFTTASGTGYGIMAILAVMAANGAIPADRPLGIVGLGIAFVLVSAGLLSSTFHLGHPERAWRALTQWRTSWLSREGVVAILTYVPWALLAYAWIIEGEVTGNWRFAAAAAAALAVATIYCTAMIYASLRTIHQWANRWTVPVYLALGLAGGAVWTAAILAVTVGVGQNFLAFAAVVLLVAWRVKRTYWTFIDTTRHPSTPKSATGLAGASVRLLEGPHTEENYLQQEMGFKVARKHADKLRRIVHGTAFAGPILLLIAAYLLGGTEGMLMCIAAAILFSVGVVTERWLFFAQARHVVTLYYGAEAA